MKKKLEFVAGCILIISLVFTTLGFAQTATAQSVITRDSVLIKSKAVQTKYDIIDAQWYDMYEKGIVTGAGDAAKMIKEAGQAISVGDYQAADSLLTKADMLLSTYTKADLPPGWMVPNPLAADPSIMGNIHKASLEELKKVELYGSPRFNTWFQFSGKGDDGNLYGLYACVNHHGTGKAQKRVMFAISSNVWKDKPNQLEVLDLMVIPERKDNKDNLIWEAKDGDRYFKWTITKKDTTVYYKDAKRTVNLTLKTDYSFWYNRGIQPVELLPGGQTTGFEQPGKATGTMILEGKTIKVSGHGEFENYFVKGAGYREVLLKYGNEWWVVFTADQLSGIFFTGIAYRDAGLYIDGKYVIPTEFHIAPIEAKKSYTITAKTSLGDLNLKFNFWGNNPALYEYWGTMEGTLAGKPLTNGFAWIEHVPRGGVDLTQPTSRK